MMKKLFLILLLGCFFTSFSQNLPLSDNATVSVFTCGKGSQLYSTFGHTAIRIKDPNTTLDVVYNYGAFDFRTENFYLKFVKGDLQYFMNVTSFTEFIYEYQYDKREVIEQTLNLTLDKKQQLFERLNASYGSEDKFYTYKFIDKNCTTMVVDKINETIGKPLIQKVDDTSISYRTVLYPYFENYFWNKLGINIIFGQRTDEKAAQLFLPIELLHSLDQAKIDGKPLVLTTKTIANGQEDNQPFSFLNSIYSIALVLLLLLLTNKRWVFISYLFALGLLGLFLSLVGLYSLHKEVLWNYNVLLFNPVYLLLPFLNWNWCKKIILFSSVLLVVYVLIMITKPHLFLMIPFILANGFMLWKLYRKKLLPSIK
jgi:Domain of unknown function (DUF4105)